MSRETYVMRDGKLVPKRLASPKHAPAGRAHHVISDDMPAAMHMMDGKTYESKSQFRAATRAHGCVEAGNDPAISRDPGIGRIGSGGIEADVKRAMQQIASR